MDSKFSDVPDEVWERVRLCLPAERRRQNRAGRPPLSDRVVMSGILYRLRTGCQWDALPSEFGSGSTCFRRFKVWQRAGVFRLLHLEMLLYYDQQVGIDWAWASLDSVAVKAPKGGTSPDPTQPIAPNSGRNGTLSPTETAFLLASL
jgi:transposase